MPITMRKDPISIIVCTILTLCLGSCISDDLSTCPPDSNVTLRFSYPDFQRHIGRLNVGIFDQNGRFVESRQVEGKALQDLRGCKLKLDSGTYTAVCWANAFENTFISGFGPGSKLTDITEKIVNKAAKEGYTPSNNDSLYFARLDFQVKGGTDTVAALIPSFIKLDIQVKGLPNIDQALPQEERPFIKIKNLATEEDFNMLTGSSGVFVPEGKVAGSEHTESFLVNALPFEEKNNILIEVYEDAKSTKVIWTLKLQDLISQYHIKIVKGRELTIPVRINFISLSTAQVTVDSWGGISTHSDLF